ncbi:MAG: hypothetical protein ABMB14_15580 [Myxococcota bacterium]
MVTILALVACQGEPPAGSDPDPRDPTADPEVVVELPPVALLTRASLDLRGVRPSPDEIARVEADPTSLDAELDAFMADDRFGDRVADLFAEVFLTETETYLVNFAGFDVADVPYADVVGAIGREPLEVLATIAREDLPVTELVTADWTMADDVLARMWPVDYPAGETGWKKVHYTDARPAAGLLAANSMWWRYQTTDSNANRGRANVVSRLFLCHDYLTRPIEFDRNVNLLDEAAITDALRTNPGCMNCHVSLDPLAAYFFGFSYQEFTGAEVSEYHPARERNWELVLGTPPAYYGDPGDSLADLGRQIAGDNRFPECVVEHVTELLLRRDTSLLDADRLTAHREALLAGGMTLRPLFDSVLHSPEYRAATDAGLPGTGVPLKMVTPSLLASQVRDLTGFDWETADGYDLIGSDSVGFLSLAGGADGVYAVKNSTSPNTTLLLVQERLAEAASDFVVSNDLADPANARLFTAIDFTETPDTDRDAMAAQIQQLHLRLFAHRVDADGQEVEANLGLWSDLYAVDHDPVRAWTGVLSALLRDPDFLLY